MKFKVIFILFNVLIIFSFAMILILPATVFGSEYAAQFWKDKWFIGLFFVQKNLDTFWVEASETEIPYFLQIEALWHHANFQGCFWKVQVQLKFVNISKVQVQRETSSCRLLLKVFMS